jgi:VCBS repeat-containing protein
MDLKNDVTAQSDQTDQPDDNLLLNQEGQPVVEGLNVEVAARTEGDLGDPIGSVETLEGLVTVTRADGSSFTAEIGDKLFQGDTIETATDGGIGVVFADTSTLALGEEGELVLDELVYDPGNQEGSSIISLVEGSMDYVSGQIAKINPDAVAITTPVATIGIRGTKVFVEYVNGEFRVVNLLEPTLDGEAAGEIVLYDLEGNPLGTINEAGSGWEFSEVDGEMILNLIKLDPSQVEQLTGKLEELLPESLIEKARDALELKEALEEAAALAAEEVRLAEEAKEAALEAAEEAEQLLADALAQLKLIQAELASVEAELQSAQLRLNELLNLNNGTLPQNAIALQTEIVRLRETNESLLREIKRVEQRVEELREEAEERWDLYNLASDDADGSTEIYDATIVALNEITEVAENATEEVASNDGYEANSYDDGDDTDNLSIEELTNLSTASGGDGNQDHLLSGGGDDDGAFQPHDQNEYESPTPIETGSQQDDEDTGGTGGVTTTQTTTEEREDDPVVINEPQTVQLALNGRVVDGYLQNARVFFDDNLNGKWDEGEIFTLTDASGQYQFTENVEASLVDGPLMIEATETTVDVATGRAFYGTMMAPGNATDGSVVITPVTSLVSSLIEHGTGLTETTAQAIIEDAFGLSPDGLLSELDPVSDADTLSSAKIAALGVQVQTLIHQAGKSLQGLGADGQVSEAQASAALYEALAKEILAQGDGFSVSDATDIQAVVEQAYEILFGAPLNSESAEAAALGNVTTVVGSLNALIDGYVAEGISGTDMLAAISRVAVVSSDVADTLEGGSYGFTVDDNFVAGLEELVANAEIGDVTGNGGETFNELEDNSVGFTLSYLLENDADTATVADVGGMTLEELQNDGLVFDGVGTLSYDGSNFIFDPVENWNGTLEIPYTVEVDETTGETKVSSIVINMKPVNDDPVVTVDDEPLTVSEGSEILTGSVAASDVDEGDTLSYTLVGEEPAGLTFNDDGTYSFDPTDPAYDDLDVNETRDVTFTYAVSDGTATVTGSLTIEVTGTNDAPEAQEETQVIVQDSEDDDPVVTGSVTADDAEGDNLTFSIIDDEETPAPDGLSFNDDGTFEFDTEDEAYDYLDDGEEHTETFSYTVTDDAGETDTGEVSITFNGTNDAPVAHDDVIALVADQGLSASFQGIRFGDENRLAKLEFTLSDLDFSTADEPFSETDLGFMHAQGWIDLTAGVHTFDLSMSGFASVRLNLGDEHLFIGNIGSFVGTGENEITIEEDGPVEFNLYYYQFSDDVSVNVKLDGETIDSSILSQNIESDLSQIIFHESDLLANDSDAEDHELSIDGFSFDEDEIESITMDDDGFITVTVGDDFNVESSFTYEVSDGSETDTATVFFDMSSYDGDANQVGYDGSQNIVIGTDGDDTLMVSDGVDLNLTDHSLALYSIENISLIDGEFGHTVDIDVQAVQNMTGDKGFVMVSGSAHDTINLSGGDWQEESEEVEGYSVYKDSSSNAELHVSSAVNVAGI